MSLLNTYNILYWCLKDFLYHQMKDGLLPMVKPTHNRLFLHRCSREGPQLANLRKDTSAVANRGTHRFLWFGCVWLKLTSIISRQWDYFSFSIRVWPPACQLIVFSHDRRSRRHPALRSGEWRCSQGLVNRSVPSVYNHWLYGILNIFPPLPPILDKRTDFI